MKTRLLASVAVAGLLAPTLRATDHAECSHLTMLKLPDVKVTEATAVPAASAGAISAGHCRGNGVVGSEIHFTLLLPDEWDRGFRIGAGAGVVGPMQHEAE